MSRHRTLVAVTAIVGLVIYGVVYVTQSPEIDPGLVATIAAGIAGVGGYELRERGKTRRRREAEDV